MKVVGLSGAQGGGKSSLLLELKARGWRLDSFRVSRAVQAQLGWESLDRVMDSPETMMQFQNEVFAQKFKQDLVLSVKADHEFEPVGKQNPDGLRGITCEADPEYAHRNGIILTERTFADIVAYTNLWTWRFVDKNKLTLNEAIAFLADYTHQCARAQNTIYSATLLLPMMSHVEWQNDPNRASKQDVVSVYEDIERFVDRKTHVTHPRYRITAASVAERADQVEAFLRTL